MRFRGGYFIAFLVLLAIEILIALYVNDKFVRPYLGDVFVIGLMYAFVMSFVKVKPIVAAIGVLMFAFIIEVCQYLNMVEILGLQHSRLARTVLGTSFSWADLVLYVVGFAAILMIERIRKTSGAVA
jgi:uncharacterized membrane protein YuzA (DUF378 family)